jgi:ubiquinone/menaquinone biosynthesis C-methylase UbiE
MPPSPFPDHFSTVAARYADFRPQYPASLFDHLASLVPSADNTTVWDCAAGSGQAAVDLAKRFPRVIATDASPEQIASAKPSPNIEYRVAPAEASGLPDQSVALVTVAQALHWFDLPKFYAEVDRVLIPGGVLAAWSYAGTEVEGPAVNAAVQHFYDHTIGSYWPPQSQLVEQGYRTIPFPFHELQPPAFRMETRWTLPQLMGYFSTWSAVTRYLQQHGQNPIEPLTKTLLPLWGDPDQPRQIVWPLSVRISRK